MFVKQFQDFPQKICGGKNLPKSEEFDWKQLENQVRLYGLRISQRHTPELLESITIANICLPVEGHSQKLTCCDEKTSTLAAAKQTEQLGGG